MDSIEEMEACVKTLEKLKQEYREGTTIVTIIANLKSRIKHLKSKS